MRGQDTASETLGFRTLEPFAGRDVLALKLMLHALGYYRPGDKDVPTTGAARTCTRKRPSRRSTGSARTSKWGTTVPGFVDARVIERLWLRLEEKGRAREVRRRLLELNRMR